jgi:hypothetical protein
MLRADTAAQCREGVASAGVEPAHPRVRAGSSSRLSYEAVSSVAGRNRTCGAPRFRRALYRAELRPREGVKRRVSGRGWTRTSSLLCVRQALSAIELLAHVSSELRDKGLNLDLHGQSVASCRLDDPGSHRGRADPAPLSTSRAWEIDAAARHRRLRDFMSRSAEAERCFSEPLAYPSTLDRRPPGCAT